MSKGDVVTAPDGAALELGDVGTSIVFENEHLRVWEVRLEPGQVQDWHLHHHPYLIIAIEGANNHMEFLDGSEDRHMVETTGRTIYREAGKVHKLTNEGQTRYVSRLIELKHLGSDGEPIAG